jgi:resuscitation-promoting factor RpfA
VHGKGGGVVGEQRGQRVGQRVGREVGREVGQRVRGRVTTDGGAAATPDRGRRDRRRETAPPARVRPRRQVPPRPADDVAGRLFRAVALVTVWVTTTGGLGVLVGEAASGVRAPGPARIEDAVTLVAGGAALAAAWWLAVAVLASVGAALLARHRPGGVLARAASGVARRTAPAGLRRAVVLAVGLSLAGAAPALAAPRLAGPAGPPAACAPVDGSCLDPSWGTLADTSARVTTAAAAGGATAVAVRTSARTTTGTDPAAVPAVVAQPSGRPTTPVPGSPPAAGATGAAAGSGSASLDPGWVPAAPAPVVRARPPVAMPGPALRPRHAARAEVVVRAGDTLWAIVERHLGPHATAAEVAAEWPRWHATNRATLGEDPDRLLPGQVLQPPGAAARDRVRPPGGPGASTTGTPTQAAAPAGVGTAGAR